MPQRALTGAELSELSGTPFGQMKKILEERQIPARYLALTPEQVYQDLRFRLTVQRCDYDHSEPYLCIQEATNSVGFLFTLDGELMHIVNYK